MQHNSERIKAEVLLQEYYLKLRAGNRYFCYKAIGRRRILTGPKNLRLFEVLSGGQLVL